MKYYYPATLHPEPDGRLSIWFEDLPGCATYGDDLPDAIYMAGDALPGWLYAAEKHGVPIPPPSDPSAIPLEPGETITYVFADTDVYRRRVESYAVKKTLTIPAWLAEKADAANTPYSQVLQEALRARLGL